MVTRDDIVGFVRQPCIQQLRKLHESGLEEDDLFHNQKHLYPKINLQDELQPTNTRHKHMGNRLTLEDSQFIINHPQYWGMCTKLNVALLAFGMTVPDTFAHYQLCQDTAKFHALIKEEQYELAFQEFMSLYLTINSILMVRDIVDTGMEYTTCLPTQGDLDLLIRELGFSKQRVLPSFRDVKTFTKQDRDRLVSLQTLVSTLNTRFSTFIATELGRLYVVLNGRYQEYQTEELFTAI